MNWSARPGYSLQRTEPGRIPAPRWRPRSERSPGPVPPANPGARSHPSAVSPSGARSRINQLAGAVPVSRLCGRRHEPAGGDRVGLRGNHEEVPAADVVGGQTDLVRVLLRVEPAQVHRVRSGPDPVRDARPQVPVDRGVGDPAQRTSSSATREGSSRTRSRERGHQAPSRRQRSPAGVTDRRTGRGRSGASVGWLVMIALLMTVTRPQTVTRPLLDLPRAVDSDRRMRLALTLHASRAPPRPDGADRRHRADQPDLLRGPGRAARTAPKRPLRSPPPRMPEAKTVTSKRFRSSARFLRKGTQAPSRRTRCSEADSAQIIWDARFTVAGSGRSAASASR